MNKKNFFVLAVALAMIAVLGNHLYDLWLSHLVFWVCNVDSGYGHTQRGLVLVFGLFFPGLVLFIVYLLMGKRKSG